MVQSNRKRQATAAVELAVCMPFLLIIIFGVWEVGRMVQAQQIITNAVREGGRQAAAGRSNATTVRQTVVNYLVMNGLKDVTLDNVTLTNLTDSGRTDPSTAEQLDHFRVTVNVPYASIRWSTLAQITSVSTLTASADWYSMRDVPIVVSATIPAN